MDQKLLGIEKLTKKYTKKQTVDETKMNKKLKKNGYNVEMDVFHVIFWMVCIQCELQKIENLMKFKNFIRKK